MNGLNIEEIKKLCKTEILYFDETDSTNSEAKRKSHYPDKTVFIADVQTSGRGRRGRQWISGGGRGVWMSILLKPGKATDKIPQITLAAGLAVCRALKKFGIASGIKWPNDIVVNGKKICGILAEMCNGEGNEVCVIVGIGINVNFESFPEEIKNVATSVFLETNKKNSRCEIIAAVLEEFWKIYAEFLAGNSEKNIAEYKKECASLGKMVRVILPDDEFEAYASDINEKGEIVVEKDGEKIALNSGEVSVSGMLGYV